MNMTSVARRREHDDSAEYSDASQENEQNNSGNDVPPRESDYDSRGSESDLSDKEQEGQEAERRVDDDEDRSNPQYIPKRGTFYEHDDRTAAGGEESADTTVSDPAVEKREPPADAPPERRRPPRKSEIIDKWSHDKYRENEQIPKSRDELVAIYGYDIRNEDAPPHARRNRRYGRGPNKYTRTWEDEEAYRRQATANNTPKKPPSAEDFPDLDASKRQSKKRQPRPRSKSQPASNESSEDISQLRRNPSMKSPNQATSQKPVQRTSRLNTSVRSTGSQKSQNSKANNNISSEKMPAIENLTITTSVNNNSQAQRKVNAAPVAQQRPVPTAQGKKPAPPTQSESPPPAPRRSPPRAAPAHCANTNESRGSKRYSSLRQRPIAENYSVQTTQQASQQPTQQPPVTQQAGSQQQQQQQQQPHRYAEFGPAQLAPAQMHPQQQIMHQQVHRSQQAAHGPSPPHQNINQNQHAQQQQVRLGLLEQQQMVPHHQMHNMQQHNMVSGQLPPAQGYAPPAMMPAQYMQSAPGAVFGGPLYGQPPPAPYPHQLYAHHNYPPIAQPAGVTYYSPSEQEVAPRPARRPTAAIPILRPSDSRPPNTAEKDNIDRIVENMFVRKPWPATGISDPKDKSQPANEARGSQEPTDKESQPDITSSSTERSSVERTESKEAEKEPEQKVEEKIEEEVSKVTETVDVKHEEPSNAESKPGEA